MEADFIDSCALRKCRRLLLLGWLLLVVGCTQEQLSGEVAAISAVDYVLSDSTSPPPPTANWQPYQLPHGSRWPQPSQSHLIYWFRASLPEQATAQLQGLYFYRYSESIDVYVNGVYLGGDSHKPGFDTAAWNHPLLVAVQPASWRSFDNQVLIRFEATKLGGVFAGFLVGDYQQLRALYDERYFQQITVNQWLLSLGVVATALALVLWLARRQEPLLWQFAASSCCWLVVTTHMVLYYLPVPDQWWLPFVHMAIDGWIYFLCRFMSTWFGLANAKQLRWQRYLLLLALLWHALAPLPAWWPLAYVLHSIGIGFVLYSQCLGAVACRAAPQLQRSLLLIVLLQVLCYGHDLFALVLAVQPSWQTASHWSQLVFPLLQIIFLLHLLRRYLHALTVAETLNAGLEARVASAKQALQVAYAQAHQAELQKVAEQERIRIYRDLHDEVGFKLLSIVHGGRDSTAAALASAALTNLREAVARANKPPLALASFLEELQEEMRLRLSGAGIRLAWLQGPNQVAGSLSSQQNYHLSRLFRELVNNIIRHASASAVEVAVQAQAGHWLFTVSDDGCGFDQQHPGSGMQAMQQHAEALGAELAWRSSLGAGCQCSLRFNAP